MKFAPLIEISFGTFLNDLSLNVKSSTCGYNCDLLSVFLSNYDYQRNWFLISQNKIGDSIYPIDYYDSQIDFSSYKSLSDLKPLQLSAGYHGLKLSDNDFNIEDKIVVKFSPRKINVIKIVFDKAIYSTKFKISLAFSSELDIIYSKTIDNNLNITSINIDYYSRVRFLIFEFEKLNKVNSKLIINSIQVSFVKYFDSNSIVSIKYSKKKNTSKDLSGIIYKTSNVALINKNREFDFINKETLINNFGSSLIKIFMHNGVKFECMMIGIIKEFDSNENDLTVKISAVDYLKYLENTPNYEKINKDYSFFDAITNNLKKIGVKNVISDNFLKDKIIDLYYTNSSISKTIVDLAFASNVLVKISPTEDEAILFDVSKLYYYNVKKIFDLKKVISYNQQKYSANPNFLEYGIKGKTFQNQEYIAKSLTVFHGDFIKRDLPIDIKDEKYIYSLGYGVSPSFSVYIKFNDIGIVYKDYLRLEITDVIQKYIFEYKVHSDEIGINIDFWIFENPDQNNQTEITVIAKKPGNSTEIAKVIQDIPSIIESLKYYLPNEDSVENRNQLVEPYIIESTNNEIIDIDNIVIDNEFIKGIFEYNLTVKSDGYIVKIWNYSSYTQVLSLSIFGKKLIDKDVQNTVKEFDNIRLLEEGQNKKIIDNNIYLENYENTRYKMISLMNLYRVLFEEFRDIKVKVSDFEDFNIGVNDIIVIESIRGYGFLPILINGLSFTDDNSGINLNFEGSRLDNNLFLNENICDSFIVDNSILE